MSIAEKRKTLHDFIDNSDEKVVESLYSIISNPQALQEDFLKNYNRDIDEAMARIDKGFFIKHEDVEKEAEAW